MAVEEKDGFKFPDEVDQENDTNIDISVEGEGDDAKFTFKGEPKGGTPDSPEALEPEAI